MIKNKLKSLLISSKTPFFNNRYFLTCTYRINHIHNKPFTKSSSSKHMDRHVKDPYVKKAKSVKFYLI